MFSTAPLRPAVRATVDPRGPVALYEQLKQILSDQIERGVLRAGEELPADRDICERFGVSRITVTRALGDLARSGLIERTQGRRSVVLAPRVRRSFDELIGLTETLRRQGLSTHSHLLSRSRVGRGELPDGDGFRARRFVRIKRLRFVGERRAVIATSFLPERLAAKLTDPEVENGSFYELFERVLQRRITKRDYTIVPVVADAETASLLGASRNSAHFCVHGKTYVGDGELIELTRSIFNGDLFEFGASMRAVRPDAV